MGLLSLVILAIWMMRMSGSFWKWSFVFFNIEVHFSQFILRDGGVTLCGWVIWSVR
jgi:hypothetical protein